MTDNKQPIRISVPLYVIKGEELTVKSHNAEDKTQTENKNDNWIDLQSWTLVGVQL